MTRAARLINCRRPSPAALFINETAVGLRARLRRPRGPRRRASSRFPRRFRFSRGIPAGNCCIDTHRGRYLGGPLAARLFVPPFSSRAQLDARAASQRRSARRVGISCVRNVRSLCARRFVRSRLCKTRVIVELSEIRDLHATVSSSEIISRFRELAGASSSFFTYCFRSYKVSLVVTARRGRNFVVDTEGFITPVTNAYDKFNYAPGDVRVTVTPCARRLLSAELFGRYSGPGRLYDGTLTRPKLRGSYARRRVH